MRCIVSVLAGTLLMSSVVHAAAPARSFLDLDLKQNRYLGGIQNTTQVSNYTVMAGELNLEAHTPGFNFKIDSLAQGAFETGNELYFGVPEAYAEPRLGSGFSLTIGRQRRHWSQLDEEFSLGVWQPQLRWDYLQPVQQGLVGMFFDWDALPSVHVTFFTSPLSIPDQGPQFQMKNGRFISGNRWFVQPQTQVQLFPGVTSGKDVPLYYDLDRPRNEELIAHSSFALSVRYQADTPFWTQISYAYKPRNQIHLGVDCPSCLSIPNEDVTAVIHPMIVKHQVITWEAGFDRYDDSGWFSLSGDIPNPSGFPASYQESPLNSMLITGTSYQHYVRPWFGVPSWLKFSYLRVFEFKGHPKPGMVGDGVQSSLDRYPLTEVVAAEWRALLSQAKGRRWEVKTRYDYSIPEQGGWLSASVNWVWGRVSWNFGLDILGASVDPNSSSAGLFSRYRSNDRVFGGLSYVF